MDRNAMLARMQAILDAAADRALTVEEQAEFDDLEAKVAQLDNAAAIASDRAARMARVVAAREAAPVVAAVPAAAVPATAARPGSEQPREFEHIGEFVIAATMRPNDPRLANLWREPGETQDRGNDRRAEQRMDTGSLGGFMVPEQFVPQIREVQVQGALVRPRATVIAAGSPPDAKITFPYLDQNSENVYGGVTVNWVDGEGGAKPATGGKLGVFSLQPNEWAATITFTDKLLRNWAAAGQFFVSRISLAAAAFEDNSFFRVGTGSGEPLSILNSDAKLIVESSGAAGTVSFEDVIAMEAVHMVGPGSVWSISRALKPQITALRNTISTGGDGSLVYVPGDITKGIPATLLGIPVYWNDRAPAANVLGSMALLNLEHYIIKDGSGPFIASDGGIVNFANNKTIIKVFGNVDGQPDLKQPFQLEGGVQVSPFVILNTAA